MKKYTRVTGWFGAGTVMDVPELDNLVYVKCDKGGYVWTMIRDLRVDTTV